MTFQASREFHFQDIMGESLKFDVHFISFYGTFSIEIFSHVSEDVGKL